MQRKRGVACGDIIKLDDKLEFVRIQEMNIRFKKRINKENALILCGWSNKEGKEFVFLGFLDFHFCPIFEYMEVIYGI